MELFETELSTLQGGPLPINGLMQSYKWVTGFYKLLLGVIALFYNWIRGQPCMSVSLRKKFHNIAPRRSTKKNKFPI